MMTDFHLEHLNMKSSTFSLPFFVTPSFPLFPPALAVGVSVLDVFLSSHAEMSAFRVGQGRKVPILLPG